MNRTIQKKVDRNISYSRAGQLSQQDSFKNPLYCNIKDSFGIDLGSKTSRIPEHMFRVSYDPGAVRND